MYVCMHILPTDTWADMHMCTHEKIIVSVICPKLECAAIKWSPHKKEVKDRETSKSSYQVGTELKRPAIGDAVIVITHDNLGVKEGIDLTTIYGGFRGMRKVNRLLSGTMGTIGHLQHRLIRAETCRPLFFVDSSNKEKQIQSVSELTAEK